MTVLENEKRERQAEKLVANYKENKAWWSDCFKAKGVKPSRTVIRFDELATQLSKDDWKKFLDWIFWDEISKPDLTPERRRELLADKEMCPCCQQFLGHNNPPADAGADDPTSPPRVRHMSYRRQTSFDFGPGRSRG